MSYLGRGGRRISGRGLGSSSGSAPAGVTAQQAGPPPPAHPPPPTAAGPERGLDGPRSPRMPSASKGGGGDCGYCCGLTRAAALVPAPAPPPPPAAAASSSPPLPSPLRRLLQRPLTRPDVTLPPQVAQPSPPALTARTAHLSAACADWRARSQPVASVG